MKIKLYSLGLGTILASVMFAACGGTESGGVVNTTNANRSNSPNTATVVNANNSNTGVVSTTNSNVNRWANANSVTREEYNTRRAEYERGKDTSETIGQGANDSWLWFKTRAALLTTNDLRESTINVDVVNDVVTLKGTVETAAQKTKAEQVAKGIEGVKSVKNELKVSAGDSITNQMTGSGNSNTRSNANTNRR